jgi:hypothetical protein
MPGDGAIILGGLIGCENCSNQGRGPGTKKEGPGRAGAFKEKADDHASVPRPA